MQKTFEHYQIIRIELGKQADQGTMNPAIGGQDLFLKI